ncbi:hypothetical protein ASC99_28770 [Kitasatospora sp. Root107]|nr:hypothetical protein ASC99_28770 [Kitasatospora sp. Root107]
MVGWPGRSLSGGQPVQHREGVGDRGPGGEPGQEAQLVGVDVADPGQVALVQQRGAERAPRIGGQPADRLGGVPVRAQQVGTEMADHRVLVRTPEQLDHRQPVPDGRPPLDPEHHPDLVPRPSGPPLPRAVQLPAAVHPQVGVQSQPAVEPGQ